MEKWSAIKFNPEEQTRKTVRLKYHDYARPGYYYLTICTFEGQHYFGEIHDVEMQLSAQGKIAVDFLEKLSSYFPNVTDITYIVMPHHLHLLFYLDNNFDEEQQYKISSGETMDSMTEVRKCETRPSTVSSIVRSIKSGITRRCHESGLTMKWHPRFYDQVVRTTDERMAVIKYIEENPVHWHYPKSNPFG